MDEYKGAAHMKRYFFIQNKNLVFEVIVNKKAMQLTLEEISATTNISGLKEIDIEEYNKLEKLYSS